MFSNSFPNNLPVQLTSFVGREREMQEIQNLLAPATGLATHLLTLIGSGGTGKTRLALEIAAVLMDKAKEGVWFIELEGLEGEAQIVPTITGVLNLSEQIGKPLLTTLTDYLNSHQVLLILDNCEHLLVGCARLVESLLRFCPQLRIITTSREALGIKAGLSSN